MDLNFIQCVETYVPPGFWILLAEDFEQDYLLAAKFCNSRFAFEEAHDLLGYERRARTETSLAQNAARFEHRGLRARGQTNASGSAFHREVVAGPIVLTTSFVNNPGGMVQPGHFRDTLARDLQRSWLDEDEVAGNRLYAIVLHGVRRVGRNRTNEFGFFELAVPNRECTKYLEVYNLAHRYADHEIDPEDIESMVDRGVPVEQQRRPSTLLRQYRRQATDASRES